MRSKSGSRHLFALTIFVAIALASLAAEAEWERQRGNIQDENKGFPGICAVSSSFAVAAGVVKTAQSEGGAVFVTRDGLNWANASPATSGGQFDIHVYLSCYFTGQDHGYVGGVGEIWVTDDSALSWTKVGLGGIMSGRAINGITGLGSGRPAFAVTALGQVLRTDDDGASWPEWASPLGEVELRGAQFLDEQTGWIWSGKTETNDEGEVTGYSEGGLALTTDGGQSWQVIFEGEGRSVLAVQLIDAHQGFLLSRSLSGATFERTGDGGLSWEPAPGPTESVAGEVVGYNDVHFFDACEGLVLGEVATNRGAVWRTRDGGESWEEFDREFLQASFMGLPIEASITTFDFVSRRVGWAAGSYETISRYDADDDPPECEGGEGGDGDGDGDDGGGSGGGRCSCRAPGGGGGDHPLGPLLMVALAAAALLPRRLL